MPKFIFKYMSNWIINEQIDGEEGIFLTDFVFVQSLSCVWCFAMPWTAACQAPLSFTVSWSWLRCMSIEWWCHPIVSSSATSFSFCPQSFPASGSFPESVLHITWPEYWSFSFSISLSNQHSAWFLLGLTGLISMLSKGLRVFPSTTIQKHQFFGTQPSLWFNSHIHDYWKNCSFDHMDFCWQSNVSTF